MAEEIFNFLDFTRSADSFDEFEALWTQMGEQLEKDVFLPSPPPPQRVVTATPVISNDSTNIPLGMSFKSSCTSDKRIASEPSSSFPKSENLITLEPSSFPKSKNLITLEPSSFPKSENLITLEPSSFPKSEKLITLEPSSFPKYSPAHDENWPPVIDKETGEKSYFNDVEDSILTTFRRKNPKKYNALERKLRVPLQENVPEQFQLLRNLQKRMSEDMQQSVILLNYLEDQCSTDGSMRKRVKLTTFQ